MKKSLFVVLVSVIAALSTMVVAERKYSEMVLECAGFERPSVTVIVDGAPDADVAPVQAESR